MSINGNNKKKVSLIGRLLTKDRFKEEDSLTANPRKITDKGGLGDKYRVIEEIYGMNSGHDTWGRFKNDAIVARFYFDRVVQFMLDLNKLQANTITRSEVKSFIQGFIPQDSKLMKSWVNEQSEIRAYFYLFESELLKQVFDHDTSRGLPTECFTVIVTENEKGIYLMNIFLGEYVETRK